MKQFLFLAIFLYVYPAYAYDVVDEILELTGTQKDYETQYAGLAKTIYRDNARKNSNDVELQKHRQALIEKQEKLFEDKLSWDSVEKELKKIYYQVYSEEELLVYVEFLRKDAGVSFIKKNNQFIDTFRQMMERRGSEYVSEKDVIIKEYNKHTYPNDVY